MSKNTPKIQHQMVAPSPDDRRGGRQTEKEINVYNVMPAEDEAMFNSQMAGYEQEVHGAPQLSAEEHQILQDNVLQSDMTKKNTLEKLLLFRKPRTKEVKLEGIKFKLKLLNSNESNQVYKEVLKLPNEEQLAKTSLMLLSAALVEADGMPLEEAYDGPSDITTPMLQRYYLLSSWHSPLVNSLTSKYQAFVKEVEGEYSKDFLGEKSQ